MIRLIKAIYNKLRNNDKWVWKLWDGTKETIYENFN